MDLVKSLHERKCVQLPHWLGTSREKVPTWKRCRRGAAPKIGVAECSPFCGHGPAGSYLGADANRHLCPDPRHGEARPTLHIGHVEQRPRTGHFDRRQASASGSQHYFGGSGPLPGTARHSAGPMQHGPSVGTSSSVLRHVPSALDSVSVASAPTLFLSSLGDVQRGTYGTKSSIHPRGAHPHCTGPDACVSPARPDVAPMAPLNLEGRQGRHVFGGAIPP